MTWLVLRTPYNFTKYERKVDFSLQQPGSTASLVLHLPENTTIFSELDFRSAHYVLARRFIAEQTVPHCCSSGVLRFRKEPKANELLKALTKTWP